MPSVTPPPELQSQGPVAVLSAARNQRRMLQDFRPLAASIEWAVGQLYWEERGSSAFVGDAVPYTITNDGYLSANAAAVFFSHLAETEAAGREGQSCIPVLEVGVGIGLFARYFLDAFRALCERYGRDYYQRLKYVAADRSGRMLADAARHGVLDAHSGRYELRVLDALHPEHGAGEGGFRAVFLNYVLDSLPAAVLRISTDRIEQLCIRTCLARDVDLAEHTSLSFDDLARKAGSDDPAGQRELVDLYDLFTLDYAYRVADPDSIPYAGFSIRDAGPGGGCILHNYGALQCLEGLAKILHENGFILLNDYGYTETDGPAEAYLHQRFSGSTAIGLNFPLLKAYVETTGLGRWIEPEADHGHLYARLLGHNLGPATVARFQQCFGKAAFERAHQPLEEARAYLGKGRYEAALGAYQEALKAQPNNFMLLEEASRFLAYTLRDYAAGLAVAQAGLAANPLSPELWNTFGDCLYYLGRVDEAHQAFIRALELNPADLRARYNLIYTLIHYKDYTAALKMIAEGLARDPTGDYRQRLLERQAEILGRLSQHQQLRKRRLADRFTPIHPV